MLIQDYLDKAKIEQGIKSDRQLALAVGVKSSNISQFRKGTFCPADKTMITIAQLAGEDINIALLRLNIWRSGAAGGAQYYKNILKLLQNSVASLLILVTIMATPTERVQASTHNHNQAYSSDLLLISLSQVRVLFGEPLSRFLRYLKSLLNLLSFA